MSNFKVEVVRIDSVENHSNADRLSINKIGGFECISNKLDDGSHRYTPGSLVVYIPEFALVPEWLLKKLNFWDTEKNCGVLTGPDHNRVRIVRLRGSYSQGILMPVEKYDSQADANPDEYGYLTVPYAPDELVGVLKKYVVELGEDVSTILGITKWEPVIPACMRGEVCNISGNTIKFDVESGQKFNAILQDNEDIIAQEKIHGCVDYDTKIDTLEYGQQSIGFLIENKLACRVKSYNIEKNIVEYVPIEGFSIQENNNDWYKLEFDTGDFLIVTGNHRIWLNDLKCYRKTENISVGDNVLINTEK